MLRRFGRKCTLTLNGVKDHLLSCGLYLVFSLEVPLSCFPSVPLGCGKIALTFIEMGVKINLAKLPWSLRNVVLELNATCFGQTMFVKWGRDP